MLLQRIITALILAPLAILAVILLSPEWFSLIWGCIIMIAAWEWSSLAGIKRLWVRALYLLSLIGFMLFVYLWTDFLDYLGYLFNNVEIKKQSGLIEWTVIPPVLWWLLIMVLLRRAADEMLKTDIKIRYKAMIGWFVLGAAWMFLSRLRMLYGIEFTLYFLLLIWAADVAAYFVGKKYGDVKLSPQISPGKTVAGLYGAIGASFICAIGLAVYLKISYGKIPLMIVSDFALLSGLTVLVSIYGDLYISLLKRQRGVKDSGSILPGHGGVLDRMDSIIAAIPLFYAGVFMIYRSVS